MSVIVKAAFVVVDDRRPRVIGNSGRTTVYTVRGLLVCGDDSDHNLSRITLREKRN